MFWVSAKHLFSFSIDCQLLFIIVFMNGKHRRKNKKKTKYLCTLYTRITVRHVNKHMHTHTLTHNLCSAMWHRIHLNPKAKSNPPPPPPISLYLPLNNTANDLRSIDRSTKSLHWWLVGQLLCFCFCLSIYLCVGVFIAY